MNSNIITFSSMTIAVVVLLFALGPIIANLYGGHGFGHIPYGPCGGGPFTVVGGHIICTHGISPLS
ncbi:MAG: hypothetical protein WA667_02305 [Candidatus Nitrosopolaris sp.]